MAKSCNQKAKVLYLERILRETGENCAVTMQEILDKLAEYGISAERKSIYDDIEALRMFGMDVKYRRGKPGGYYLAGQTIQIGSEAELTVEAGQPEKAEMPECAGQSEITGMPENAGQQKLPGMSEGAGEQRTAETPENAEQQETAGKWNLERKEAESEKKLMRLLCSSKIRRETEAFFGGNAQYKEKSADCFGVITPLLEDPFFYGWLTAMGKKVRIVKPRKCAQAYREYLKMLAKGYKEV